MKIKELEKYVIELDELQIQSIGRHLVFKDLKQFLLEAELAEQPVFMMGNVLYYFVDSDIAMFKKYDEKEHKDYLEEWDKNMVRKKREALNINETQKNKKND